jgi:hypothetical protein
MRSGAAFLLAVLLAVFLAARQWGSHTDDDDKGDADRTSSSSSDGHDDTEDHDDEDTAERDSGDEDSGHEDSGHEDSGHEDSGHENSGHTDTADSDDDGSHDENASSTDRMTQRLEAQGLHIEQSSSDSDDDCAAHSYGQVAGHFADHPCAGLERAWYVVGDEAGNTAIVSVARVEMPDADSATELEALVDRPGTGNVTELSREDGPHGNVRYSGWYYRSDRDGDVFTSVQAEPLQSTDGSRDVARRASGTVGTE